METFFWYFAYGSNLLAERIHHRQKGAEYFCNGKLENFALRFVHNSSRWQGALATVIETPGNDVWGCVWKIPKEYSESLDKQESGYHRLNVTLQTPEGPITCRTYQFSNLQANFTLPSPHYKLVIVEGGKEHNLPAEYIKNLEEIPDNKFQGKVEVDIPILEKLNRQTEL
ncbi:unnamed protein product [Caenorhabditis angaria]|uniref:gamma-glutamylcyclotransferase n=1 Tax=Caenorhabditis angaria TaxID=860376 RepID=A0A9P1IBR6_9PELO|nr:unnamed protein product [Caenorhabditis angaria]